MRMHWEAAGNCGHVLASGIRDYATADPYNVGEAVFCPLCNDVVSIKRTSAWGSG